MPRVRLRVQQADIRDDLQLRYTQPRRPGEVFTFPALRLVTTVIAGSSVQFQAVIDTGAWVSVVTHDAWTQLDRLGLVEFLPPPAGTPTPRAIIGGGRSEFGWVASNSA